MDTSQVVIAVIGSKCAFLHFIQFLIGRHDKKKEKQWKSRQEQDLCRGFSWNMGLRLMMMWKKSVTADLAARRNNREEKNSIFCIRNEKNGTYWNIQSMYVRGGKNMTRQEIPVFKTREENVAYMNATLPIREKL